MFCGRLFVTLLSRTIYINSDDIPSICSNIAQTNDHAIKLSAGVTKCILTPPGFYFGRNLTIQGYYLSSASLAYEQIGPVSGALFVNYEGEYGYTIITSATAQTVVFVPYEVNRIIPDIKNSVDVVYVSTRPQFDIKLSKNKDRNEHLAAISVSSIVMSFSSPESNVTVFSYQNSTLVNRTYTDKNDGGYYQNFLDISIADKIFDDSKIGVSIKSRATPRLPDLTGTIPKYAGVYTLSDIANQKIPDSAFSNIPGENNEFEPIDTSSELTIFAIVASVILVLLVVAAIIFCICCARIKRKKRQTKKKN